jgi:MYXO-CTERM domain-containing protein
VTTGLCGTACFSDTDCTSAHFCPASGSTCTPKAPNGQLVPASAGVCNAVAGLRTCVSGVCEATDNLCGLRKGSLCASAAECRIGICSATDGRCGVPDGEGCADPTVCRSGFCKAGKCSVCARDADCGSVASGLVCDESTFTCVSGCRRSVGNGCPAGLACTSLDASIGQCVAIADAGAGAGDAAADATLDAAVVDAASTDAPAIVDAGGDAEPEAGPVGAESPFDTGFMAGHGLSCASAPAGGAGGSLAVLGLAAAFAAGVARRRRG